MNQSTVMIQNLCSVELLRKELSTGGFVNLFSNSYISYKWSVSLKAIL